MIAEVSGMVLAALPVLFSGLFFVAASRLNSPRFQLCLYALSNLTVKEARYELVITMLSWRRAAQLSEPPALAGGSTR